MRAIVVRAIVNEQVYQYDYAPGAFEEIEPSAQLGCFLYIVQMMQREMMAAGAPIAAHRWETRQFA